MFIFYHRIISNRNTNFRKQNTPVVWKRVNRNCNSLVRQLTFHPFMETPAFFSSDFLLLTRFQCLIIASFHLCLFLSLATFPKANDRYRNQSTYAIVPTYLHNNNLPFNAMMSCRWKAEAL